MEETLTFTPEERAVADAEDWLEYRSDEEHIIDGYLRVWRRAAADGLDLCGLTLTVY